jgi:hypothetical protein
MRTFDLLLYFNIISFLFFGITCLVSKHMVAEFIRFKLKKSHRLLTGVLQLIAVAGLILGMNHAAVGFVASLGLALLMFMGFLVRLNIKDGVYKSSPALIYMVLNGILAYKFYLLEF